MKKEIMKEIRQLYWKTEWSLTPYTIIFLVFTIGVFLLTLVHSDVVASEIDSSSEKTINIYLLRHALAPGAGDPQNFNVSDCGTQRNLSNKGRDQAVRIGKKFRDNLKILPQVFSSQWCRCKETAKLLGLGDVRELPILNSFFRNFNSKDDQTNQLKNWLLQKKNNIPIILVTHQVNITALTGIYPNSGEVIVIRMDNNQIIRTVGRIAVD